jgi:hypothetical protein
VNQRRKRLCSCGHFDLDMEIRQGAILASNAIPALSADGSKPTFSVDASYRDSDVEIKFKSLHDGGHRNLTL